MIYRPWKCKKGKDRRSPLVNSRELAEHDISPALFPAVTVTVVRDRKIRTALRTNQIAGIVTMPSWKKLKTSINDHELFLIKAVLMYMPVWGKDLYSTFRAYQPNNKNE